MIWYFLAGFVSGVVGTIMYMKHLLNKIRKMKEVEKNDKCSG